MDRAQEKRIISEKERILKAYDIGEKKSKQYTDQELQEKKKHYLSMIPEYKTLTIKRWKTEVERCFMRKSFKKCPDKYFYHLDTFLKFGM